MARTIAKDHDTKRGHILKTAARVFAEEGYARASMAEVARACGISKANIYHYYDSKDALLFDILDSYLRTLRDRLAALPLEAHTPEEQLHLLCLDILRAYQGMDHEHKIQLEGIPRLTAEQQDVLKGYQRDMVRQMGDVIERLPGARLDEDRRKRMATIMSVFGMLNWFFTWNQDPGVQAREDYAALVTRLTIGGVAKL